MTFVRMFNHKLLDMLELYLDPESFRTISQFKTPKAASGLKPLLSFSGTPFESPTPNAYTLARSLFVDLFKGHDAISVDVEALQYIIHIAAGEEVDGQPLPTIHLRVYRIITKKSGQKLPRVELEEMGPRMTFRVGRLQQADESVMRAALKKPKQLEPKTKKNIEIDPIGDKIGKVHGCRPPPFHLFDLSLHRLDLLPPPSVPRAHLPDLYSLQPLSSDFLDLPSFSLSPFHLLEFPSLYRLCLL